MSTDVAFKDSTREETRKNKRRRPRRKRKPTLASYSRDVSHKLASAARFVFKGLFGFRESASRPFTLELKVEIDPALDWKVTADPPLEEQIRNAVLEMAAKSEVFRSGRVFCYRCDSSECVHSAPPTPSCVFGGYSATGIPEWPDFAQVLIDMRHPKIETLFESEGNTPVAVEMDAEALKCRQLNIFGRHSKDYDILGQVVVGFIRLSSSKADHSDPERVALTLQVVESRGPDGSPRLDLNVIGRLRDGSIAIDALTGPRYTRIHNIIKQARRRIANGFVSIRNRKTPSKAEIPSTPEDLARRVLKEIARGFDRFGRQKERRTVHAEQRREDNRPTSNALEDAVRTSDANLFWDTHKRTVVVIGHRNRVHIFTTEGRHVTSLLLEAEAVQSRLRRKRWIELPEIQMDRFSTAIGRKKVIPLSLDPAED